MEASKILFKLTEDEIEEHDTMINNILNARDNYTNNSITYNELLNISDEFVIHIKHISKKYNLPMHKDGNLVLSIVDNYVVYMTSETIEEYGFRIEGMVRKGYNKIFRKTTKVDRNIAQIAYETSIPL